MEVISTIPKVRVIIPSGIDTSFVKSIVDEWEEQFGVTVLMESLNDEEYQKALDSGDYQVAIYNLTATDDRPYSFLSAFTSTSKLFNYSNLEVDTVLKASEQSLTTEDLVAKYSQVEKSILDSNYFVPLYYKKSYLICSNGTDKVNYNPFNYQLDFSYAVNYNQED
jgi:ABC-type oligopeptide transport system substrate-binding subunit